MYAKMSPLGSAKKCPMYQHMQPTNVHETDVEMLQDIYPPPPPKKKASFYYIWLVKDMNTYFMPGTSQDLGLDWFPSWNQVNTCQTMVNNERTTGTCNFMNFPLTTLFTYYTNHRLLHSSGKY